MKRKAISVMLSAALIAGTLAGCGSDNSDSTESTAVESTAGDSTESADSSDGETEGSSKYKDFITVDVFDSMANYQGIQSGWFAKIVKDKFNMELNIIAPNVAGGGDTLFQTRSAAGDLGDLIITGCGNGRLQNLVTAGLVIDMTDYLKDAENVHRYDSAMETTGQLVEEDGIWAIPSESSSNSPTTSSEGLEAPEGVEATERFKDGKGVMFVLNHNDEETVFVLNEARKDLLTGEQYEGGTVVTLEAKGVMLLEN